MPRTLTALVVLTAALASACGDDSSDSASSPAYCDTVLDAYEAGDDLDFTGIGLPDDLADLAESARDGDQAAAVDLLERLHDECDDLADAAGDVDFDQLRQNIEDSQLQEVAPEDILG